MSAALFSPVVSVSPTHVHMYNTIRTVGERLALPLTHRQPQRSQRQRRLRCIQCQLGAILVETD